MPVEKLIEKLGKIAETNRLYRTREAKEREEARVYDYIRKKTSDDKEPLAKRQYYMAIYRGFRSKHYRNNK